MSSTSPKPESSAAAPQRHGQSARCNARRSLRDAHPRDRSRALADHEDLPDAAVGEALAQPGRQGVGSEGDGQPPASLADPAPQRLAQ